MKNKLSAHITETFNFVPWEYNRNIQFCTLGPLVWKRVGLQNPNQHQTLFSVKDHCVQNSERSVN